MVKKLRLCCNVNGL